MLILTRKSDQEIIIDGDIRIRVLSVKGNSVRLGIEAPANVPILRGELVDRMPIDQSRVVPVMDDCRACDVTRTSTSQDSIMS